MKNREVITRPARKYERILPVQKLECIIDTSKKESYNCTIFHESPLYPHLPREEIAMPPTRKIILKKNVFDSKHEFPVEMEDNKIHVKFDPHVACDDKVSMISCEKYKK